jgi:hypothetical protein
MNIPCKTTSLCTIVPVCHSICGVKQRPNEKKLEYCLFVQYAVYINSVVQCFAAMRQGLKVGTWHLALGKKQKAKSRCGA